MTLEDLKNIHTFMQRVPLTGLESIAWVKAVGALKQEIAFAESLQPTSVTEPEKQ